MNLKIKKILLSMLTLSITGSLFVGLSSTANAVSNATINIDAGSF